MTTLNWQGGEITDIPAFCRSHGWKIVVYLARRSVANLHTGRVEEESYAGEMPSGFWENLRMADGWYYEKIREYDP